MGIISTRGIYGLTAVLVLAKNEDNDLMKIKDIATKGSIPQNYLEQILVVLKKSEIIQSIRGANGGYKLLKSIHTISVFEVLDTLEPCLIQKENQDENHLLKPFWEETNKKIKKIFMLTIAELIEFLDKKSENIVYYI